MRWYDDGRIISALFLAFVWLPAALVPIFRPRWADKVMPFRVTPQRGKLLGAMMLLAFVLYVNDLLRSFFLLPPS